MSDLIKWYYCQNEDDGDKKFEECKQKILNGCIDVEYPNIKKDEIIEFLKENKDKNDNALCQYACFILDDFIRTENYYKDAVYIIEKLAEKNNVLAQYYLGWCYRNGKGTNQDFDKTFYWYKKAAEQGHPRAQFEVGYRYHSIGKYKDAIKWYKKAGENGEGIAFYNIHLIYVYQGKDTDDNKNLIFYWCKKAAEANCRHAYYNLADYYYHGKIVKKDYKEAIYWYTKAAYGENANAQLKLGLCYKYGRGTDINYDKAKYWFTKAFDNGCYAARKHLNDLYKKTALDNKEYLKPIKVNTLEKYKQKQFEGYVDIEYPLELEEEVINYIKFANKDLNDNLFCEYGCLILDDKIETLNGYVFGAYVMYKLAKKNNAKAQYRFGLCYYKGQGGKQNYEKTIKWFEKSAKQGYPKAQYYLGKCCYDGTGVNRDINQAFYWYKEAAKNGNEDAKKALFEKFKIKQVY